MHPWQRVNQATDIVHTAMYKTKKIVDRRRAFTLVEMLVVIAIILALAALAAAFAPRVNDSRNLTRAVDNIEQWLLTAKMRAKRDGLATGVRLIQAPGDAAGTYSQFQYIQQPDPLSGGSWTSAGPIGGVLQSASAGVVTFALGSVDFTLGLGINPLLAYQYLVQPGDYLEVRDGGVYSILAVTSPNTLQLGSSPYDTALTIAAPGTTNYRILRQPRILIGEEPLALPNNYAVNMNLGGSVLPGPAASSYINPPGPATYYDIVFSPNGAVVGANAVNAITTFLVHDMTMNPFDPNRAGIIGVQSRTGFIGTYDLSPVPPYGNYFGFVAIGRESGL